MPFVHVTSLPFDCPVDIPEIINAVAEDFAGGTGIDIQHITVTWQFLNRDHYSTAGRTESYQPNNSHPLLVDLVAPDFHEPDTVADMMEKLAGILSHYTGIHQKNIFIRYTAAVSGLVYDEGEIVRWD